MRKYLTIIAAVLLVAVGSTLAVVFTAGASSAPKNATTVKTTTATLDQVQTVLQPIVQANKSVTGGSAAYTLTVTPTKSSSASASGPLAALLSNGFTVSGTVQADSTAKAFDATVAAALGTSSTPVMTAEVYWKGTEGWVNYNGTWYALPPKALKKVQQAEARHAKADASQHAAMEAKAQKLIAKLGIDPQLWLKGLTMGQDATVPSLTQISTSFDVQQIATDVVKIAQSRQFRAMAKKEMTKLEAKAGARGAAMKARMHAKVGQSWKGRDLSQLPSQAAQVVQDPQATLWVDQSAKTFNKFELTLTVVPPAQANAPITSAGINFTVDKIKLGATTVTPSTPVTDPQPWSKLQSQFKGLQKMFGGMALGNAKGGWK